MFLGLCKEVWAAGHLAGAGVHQAAVLHYTVQKHCIIPGELSISAAAVNAILGGYLHEAAGQCIHNLAAELAQVCYARLTHPAGMTWQLHWQHLHTTSRIAWATAAQDPVFASLLAGPGQEMLC
jgi:hypothetical protein